MAITGEGVVAVLEQADDALEIKALAESGQHKTDEISSKIFLT
jgi:hypothetical protein